MKKFGLLPPRHGFTLLELSIVLVIIAVVTGISLKMGIGMLESARRAATNNKLDQIEQALMAFRTANNRLPCPADVTLAENAAYFGVEATNAGACTTGSTYVSGLRTVTSATNPTATSFDLANNVVEGGVPFVALGLPKEYAYDGWGRRIAYAVNYTVTGVKSMLNQNLADKCNITVTNAGTGTRTSAALYALVSYGLDGHGAYISSGIRNNAGSTNANELTNCHCTSAATAAASYSASYVMQDHSETAGSPTNMFDDLVRYKERWQMQNYDDDNKNGTPVCSPGFRMDEQIGYYQMGRFIAVGDLNGDGIPDMAIADYYGVTVLFGTPYGFSSLYKLNTATGSNMPNGTNGFFVSGLYSPRVAIGNISGHTDGTKDLIIGNSGTLYVIYGHKGPWPASGTATSYINNSQGFSATLATGMGNILSGYNALLAGDVSGHGNGMEDLIISQTAQAQTAGLFGQVSVIFGHKPPWSNITINSAYLNGTTGAGYIGNVANDYFGWWTALGDFNGDGIKDIIIAHGSLSNAPDYTDVIFGRKTGWPTAPVTVTSITDGNNGFRITDNADLVAGYSIGEYVAAGDVNGDGYADVISAAHNSNMSLVFGKPCGIGSANGSPACTPNPISTLALTALTGTVTNGSPAKGVVFTTSVACGLGCDPVAIGDINGDGYADIFAQLPISGGTALVGWFGHGGNWPATIDLEPGATTFNGVNGIQIDAYTSQASGFFQGVSLTGDINGDGIQDLIATAYYANYSGQTNSGSAFVFYGRKNGWWTQPLNLTSPLASYNY